MLPKEGKEGEREEGRDRCVSPLIYSIPAPAALRSPPSFASGAVLNSTNPSGFFSPLPRLLNSFGAGKLQ